MAACVTCYTLGQRRQAGLLTNPFTSIHALGMTFNSRPSLKGRPAGWASLSSAPTSQTIQKGSGLQVFLPWESLLDD